MTIRAEIFASDYQLVGWVEVDPIDYSYTGDDPDGEIDAYLSSVKDGTVTFDWSPDDPFHQDDVAYPPELTLLDVSLSLESFDQIFTVRIPDDVSFPTG